VEALGISSHLEQVRISEDAAAGETATTVLQRALKNTPLVSTNYHDWIDSEFDIGGMDWTRNTLRQIADASLELGDDDLNEIMLNLWHVEDLPVVGSYTDTIAASKKDAYDSTTSIDDSYNSTVVRIGYGRGHTYVGGLIFPALGIPRYSKILSATFRVYAKGEIGANEPMDVHIHGERDGTPSDWDVSWPSARTKTFKWVQWSPANWPAGDEWLTSPDITPVIQEIVDLADYTPTSQISLILDGQNTGVNDTRKQFESKDAGAGHEAELTVTYGPSVDQWTAFHSELIARQEANEANVDYIITPDDVTGGMDVVETLAELYTHVASAYGGGSVTDWASDTSAAEEYDARYNDPSELDAGDSADVTQAEQIRDKKLTKSVNPIWRASALTVNRLRNRWGHYVHPALVRAGCVISLATYPKFVAGENARPLFVVRTQYNQDRGTLTLNPDLPVDSLAILLLRLKRRQEKM